MTSENLPRALELGIRFDMLAPAFGASRDRLYSAAHDMAGWADRNGFHTLLVGEHHGTLDGYTSAPFVVAASLASRTSSVRVRMRAMLLPLHHPIELAEQIATLDVLTGGRVEVVFGLGYVPREFAMFDVKRADRVSLIESGVELVRTALSDAEFTYSGAPARVTPAPCQRPHPPLYLGGGVEASALRAARLRVGFAPQVRFDELTALYKAECGRLRQAPGPVIQTPVAYSVFVAEDPEELWTRLARHVRHNANSYSAMTSDGQIASPFAEILHPDDEIGLRERGGSRVVTPDQFVDLAVSSANSGRMIQFVPLLAGLDPDIAWQSLELISARVLPRLKEMNLM